MALFDNLLNFMGIAVAVALVIKDKNKTQENSRLRWCVNFKELAVGGSGCAILSTIIKTKHKHEQPAMVRECQGNQVALSCHRKKKTPKYLYS